MTNIFVKMKRLVSILLLYNLLIAEGVKGQRHLQLIERRDPRVYTHFEVLDREGKYELEWVVNWGERRINFEVKVETTGFVAFGLSARGEMDGADVVVGGVNSDGSSYFSDRRGVRFGETEEDESQDWRLEGASENGTHTYLSFSRPLEPCDEQDLALNEGDTVILIWAYGERDNPEGEWQSNRNRGLYPVHLLDPNVIPRDLKETIFRPGPVPSSVLRRNNMDVWTVSARMRLPPTEETIYHCTVHKAPRLGRKHHLVGFHTRLETEEARRHVHHIILYRCYPPAGRAREMFERFLNTPGQSCFEIESPEGPIPTPYCHEVTNGYAIGARMTLYPDHVGQPFAESDDEYYILQTHYDNSDRLPNLDITLHHDTFYTRDLRPNESALMLLGHRTPGSPSILLPPDTQRHMVFGHCSPECSEAFMPPEGIRVYQSILHTHYSGRRLNFRHFRGGRELPWIKTDNNYNTTFQPTRFHQTETRVMPGDQLTVECEDTTTWTNGSVVGGYSTRQEMCVVFIAYYNRVEGVSQCRSEINDPNYWRRYLGVNNITWDLNQLDMVATSPSHLAGQTMAQISDTRVNWTPRLRQQLQEDHRSLPQAAMCPIIRPMAPGQQGQPSPLPGFNVQDAGGPVTLPQGVLEYREPPSSCTPAPASERNTNTITNRDTDTNPFSFLQGGISRLFGGGDQLSSVSKVKTTTPAPSPVVNLNKDWNFPVDFWNPWGNQKSWGSGFGSGWGK